MLRSFRSRLALAIGASTLVAVAALSVALDAVMSRTLAREEGRALSELAHSVGAVLGEGLDARLREIINLAENDLFPYALSIDQINNLSLNRAAALRSHYAWLGVADEQGTVRAATQGLLVGSDVADRAWFQEGLRSAFVGDVHGTQTLLGKLPRAADGTPVRLLDFASPLVDPRGNVVGVLGAHVNWEWAREVIAMLRRDESSRAGVRIFILNRAGEIVHRPLDAKSVERAPDAAMTSSGLAPMVVGWPDGQLYLTAAAPLVSRSPETQLGWTIVVRQPVEQAFVAVRQAQLVVWALGAGVMLLAVAGAWVVANRWSRPMYALVGAARRIEAGELEVPIPPPAGTTELRSLNRSFAAMTRTLIGRERALRHANEQLEARVEERTRELAAVNAELVALARHDELTSLPNRRAADERLTTEMLRHRRTKSGLGVLMIDIDRFKSINDTYGHARGDEVLKIVARTLKERCRASDFVARLGGEEFLVLLPDTGAAGGRRAAEALRAAVSQAPCGLQQPVTVSIGLATAGERYASEAAALAAADGALYAAKNGGRNRVEEAKAPDAQAALLV